MDDKNIRKELSTEVFHNVVIRFYKDSQTGVLALIGIPVTDRVVARDKKTAKKKAEIIIIRNEIKSWS